MTDNDKALVERLRVEADQWDEPKRADDVDMRGLLHNAADEIERLKGAWEDDARRYSNNFEYLHGEIERLREALGKLAPMVDWMPHPDCVTAEQIIRAALGETE